jgi:hypothetical protein
MGEKIYEHIILVGKFLGKRLLRTANRRWENATNTVLMGIHCENGRSTIKNVTYPILISCLSKNGYIYMTDIVFTFSFGKYVRKYKRRVICLQHSLHLTNAPELPWFRCPNICGWRVKYYKIPKLPTYATLLEEEQFAWALVTDLHKKLRLPATEIPTAVKTFLLW